MGATRILNCTIRLSHLGICLNMIITVFLSGLRGIVRSFPVATMSVWFVRKKATIKVRICGAASKNYSRI